MTKKGPLSKAEKFYIENHRELDIKDLCKDLDRAQSTVGKFLETLPGEKTAKVTSSKKPEPQLSKQFARQSGTTVMTPNASIMADEKRPQLAGRKSNRCTTTIKGD
jgi:hypothetical protein